MNYWYDESQRICKTFQWVAGDTWNRMQMYRAGHINWREESLTENALYTFAKRHPRSIRVHQFVANEHLHGADWEWWLVGPTSRLRLRIQAKKLHQKHDAYHELYHPKTKPGDQMRTLIKTSKLDGAVPLYLFYNHWSPGNPKIAQNCKSAMHPKLNGCTLAHANSIQALFSTGDTSLASVSKIATPWDCLVCCGTPAQQLQIEELPIRAAKTISGLPGSNFSFKDYDFDAELPKYVKDILDGGQPENSPEGIDGVVIIREPLVERRHQRIFR